MQAVAKRRSATSVGGIALATLLAGCGSGDGGSDAASDTAADAPLTVWEFEKVCREGTIAKATPYEATAGRVHPVLLFDRSGTDSTQWNAMTNITLKLPEPWVIEYTGDATKVELVACITRIGETLFKTCEFTVDEKPDQPHELEIYNATYEVRLLAATTGQEVARTELSASYEDCPMFHMFSSDDGGKDKTHALLGGGHLQPFLAAYVKPEMQADAAPADAAPADAATAEPATDASEEKASE